MMMSPIAQSTQPIASFLTDEEKWFSEREREKKRLARTSPTTPPPPIGDAVADLWFR